MSRFRHYPTVEVVVESCRPRLPAHIQDAIESHWTSLTAQGTPFYRGPVLWARHLSQPPTGTVQVTAAWTDFAHQTATRAGLVPEPWQSEPIFGAALVLTQDRQVVVGQMHPTTASPHRWQFPAGGAEPSDADQGRLVLERLVARELEEETGLRFTGSEIQSVTAVGGMLTHTGAGSLALLMRLQLTLGELQEVFQDHLHACADRGEAPEFTKLAGIPLDGEGMPSALRPLAGTSQLWVSWLRDQGGTL